MLIKTCNDSILVVGGAGYIGSVLVRKLLDSGYKVIVYDACIYGNKSVIDLLDNSNFKLIVGDTRDLVLLSRTIESCSRVVYLAELVGDPICDAYPENAFEINAVALRAAVDISRHYRVSKFIYTSSCSVYGCSGSNKQLIETSQLNPVSLYGKLKLENELHILKDPKTFTILRLGTVFGCSPRPRYDLIVNTFSAQAYFNKQLNVFGGKQWRPHTSVNDVSSAIIRILQADDALTSGQIFNVVGQNMRIETIAQLAAKQVRGCRIGKKSGVVDHRNYAASSDKLCKRVGYVCSTTVKQGIQGLLEEFNTNSVVDFCRSCYSDIRAFSEL